MKILSLPDNFQRNCTMRLLIVAIAFVLSLPTWAQSGASPDLPGALRIQIGTNNLMDSPSSMDLGIWGSKTFNAYYLFAMPIGESRFSFHPGFGIGTDKFSWDADVTLQRDGSQIEVVPLEVSEFGEVSKSKLATTFFDVPFELRFHLNKDDFKRSIKFAVGGKIGILMSSHTKVKFEVDGENQTLKVKDQFELNRFRYGLQGSMGIGGFNIYYYYSLNEFFKSDAGPENTAPNHSQIGVSLNLF